MLLQQLKERRTIRKYDPTRKLSPEVLDQILEAGRIAPSAKNNQPWHFFVLESEEARAKIQQCYDRSWFKDAAAYILIVGDNERAWKHPDEYGDSLLQTDGAIATTHMMLTAWDLGVGSTWVCAFDRIKCCELFGLEIGRRTPLNILALGYPDVDPKTLPFIRKPKEEVITRL